MHSDNSYCIKYYNSEKIWYPFFAKFSLPNEKDFCRTKICISEKKYRCPKDYQWFKNYTTFAKVFNYPIDFSYINKSLLESSKIIFPFYFEIKEPLKKEIFFNIKTVKRYTDTYIPIPNLEKKDLGVEYQYVNKLSECDDRFCLVPRRVLNIVTDKVEESNNYIKYKDHLIISNNKECLESLKKYLYSGDFLALAMKKADIENNFNCNFKGYGNFFSYIINPKLVSLKINCEFNNDLLKCSFWDPVIQKEVEKPKNKVFIDPILFFDVDKKMWVFTDNYLDLYRNTDDKVIFLSDKVIYLSLKFTSKVIDFLNPSNLEVEKKRLISDVIFEYKPFFKFDYRVGFDDKKNYDINNTNYNIRNLLYDFYILLDFSQIKNCSTRDYINFHCNNGNYRLNELIKDYYYDKKNKTLFLFFKEPIIINNVEYYLEPLKLKTDLGIKCQKKFTVVNVSLQESKIKYKINYDCSYINDISRELIKIIQKKEQYKEAKINVSKKVSEGIIKKIENITITFPDYLSGRVRIFNKTIDLGKYNKVYITKEEYKINFLYISLLMLFYSVLISYLIDKKRRKRKSSS